MAKNDFQICRRCVMDTTDPEIEFDEFGNCNHCTTFLSETIYKTHNKKGDEVLLNNIINKIKKAGRGKKYDCIIGISGGVDSSFTAYIAKKNGLRPLLVHLDNGWNTEASVRNIKKVVDSLGVDYECDVLNWEDFKEMQLAFFKASVPEIDTPTDVAILAILHKAAARYGVKYILSGGNYSTEGILPNLWHYNAKDKKYAKAIVKQFGKNRFKGVPWFRVIDELYYKLIRGIRVIYILNFVPFSKMEAINTLEQEMGWINYGGKHHESRITQFLHSYFLVKKHNIDYRKATFSTMICTGQLTREEALEKLKEPPYDPEKIVKEEAFICKKLGLAKEEYDKILTAPPKFFFHYPNNKKTLDYLYKIYKKYFSKYFSAAANNNVITSATIFTTFI